MISLRDASEADIQIIVDIAFASWPSTYGAYLSESQIRYMLNQMYNRNELLNQLSKGQKYLIASQDFIDIGFAGFSEIDDVNRVHKLHKLYVLPEFQSLGCGKILIENVVFQVKQQGGIALQLNVNRNNNAINFYKKNGFKIKETVDIEIGNGFFMNDFVMELVLSPIND